MNIKQSLTALLWILFRKVPASEPLINIPVDGTMEMCVEPMNGLGDRIPGAVVVESSHPEVMEAVVVSTGTENSTVIVTGKATGRVRLMISMPGLTDFKYFKVCR